MDKFCVLEVGSTNTKTYKFDGGEITEYPQKTIMFKSQSRQDHLPKIAVAELIDLINDLKKREKITAKQIFIYGTSIFRDLTPDNRREFLAMFKRKTGVTFNIATAEQESEYTVKGVIAGNDFAGRVAVMIGGGGTTEVCVVENKKIIEKHYNNFGAISVTRAFEHINDTKPDLEIEKVDKWLADQAEKIDNGADILVIAGGDFIFFYESVAREKLQPNTLYADPLQPYMLPIAVADAVDRHFIMDEDISFYYENYPKFSRVWWSGTRGQRFCVRAIAHKCGAKYIVPTRINMCLGIIQELRTGNSR